MARATSGKLSSMVTAGARSQALTQLSRLAVRPMFLAAVIGVLYLGLGVANFRHMRELDEVESQVSQVRGVLGRDLVVISDLEEQLLSTQMEVEAMERVLVDPLPDTVVLDIVLQGARKTGVEVRSATVLGPGSLELEGHSFWAAPFSIKVQGERDAVLRFLALLEEGTSETLAVKRVTLTSAETTAVAAVEFAVYSQLSPNSLVEDEAVNSEDEPLAVEGGGS